MEAIATFSESQLMTPIIKTPFKVVNKIALSFKDQIRIVPFEKIMYLEGEGNYTRFHIQKDSCFSCHTLKHYVLKLPNYFVRVHRKYLVNLNYVEVINKQDGLTIQIRDQQIPISRRHQSEFLKRFMY